MPRGGWVEWLSPRWSFQSGSVLIVDEAQLAYWDKTFWLELKAIKPESPFRVITFASYGSAGRNINDSLTPIHISPCQNISLIAHDHGDQIAVGLLLTKPEFDHFVNKLFVDHYFDVLFLDSVFDITRGHVGACQDFLRIVCAHESYRLLKSTGKCYTVDDFTTGIHMAELLESLTTSSTFSRGLPVTEHLQHLPLAQVFREVLLTGSIVVDEAFNQPSEAAVKSPLRICFESGWLHNEIINPLNPTRVTYTFASPLHERYVQCMLLGNLEEGVISESRIKDFVIAIIRKFIPLNLSASRTFGTTTQSTPEAQFRDEFYRASMSHTKGSVLSFPEFGNKRGRIDFFIPSKKWGIELLRNGNRINAHVARFTTGEYGRWIRDQKMNDYCIVDFRTSRPRSSHEVNNNLLYAVSTDKWKTIDVLDNKLVVVASFSLLCL